MFHGDPWIRNEWVYVYYQDDLNTPVASNDDNAAACGTVSPRRSSLVSYAVPSGKSGWYYIKVHEFFGDEAGSYRVRATQTAGNRDVGGSARASAFAISSDELTGRYVAGDIASGTDEDWFKVSLGDQEHVTFHTIDGSVDTVIEVHDDSTTGYAFLPSGSNRWMRRDDDGGFQTLRSHAHFVAPRAADYYVRVTNFNSASTGAYTLVVQRMGNFAPAYPAFP